MGFEQEFKSPGKEYRELPFWSWNDKLEADELRRQIDEMNEVGIGGYFMHARAGLKTEYLSEEWMKCIDASIKEGNKLGMYSWLYDEAGWPSGFAGGIIPAKGEKYQQKWMECEEINSSEITSKETTLGYYILANDLKTCRKLDSIDEVRGYAGKEKIVHIFYNVNPYYVDLLDKEVVKKFIDSTYELYYQRFGEYFGKEIPGIFTDEPQYHRRCVPWSYILENEFKSRSGYELIEKLAYLYYEIEGYEKVRYDFWKTVSDLFTTSFTKQIGEWCEKHNCMLTGHVMLEDSLTLQMSATAGAMPSYEYMQMPGIDWLWRWIGDPITPKQVSSVAHQLGQKFVLSEMFGGAGWNVSFEELKWIAEWQYVLGINIMCQHLEEYSLKGVRKRDFPASLFYQQSWWKEYKLFNDYFARLGVALTEGKHKADVLVIHPIRSAWAVYNNINKQAADELNEKLKAVSTYLLNMHMDFDYGDEGIIDRYGKVESSKFVIGACEYDVVVLPSNLTLDSATIKLLEEFINNGGKVIAAGRLPVFCEGGQDDKLLEINKKITLAELNKESLKEEIVKHIKPSVAILDSNGCDIDDIYYQQRYSEDKHILFMVNINREKNFEATIDLKVLGKPSQWILENGDNKDLDDVEYTENGIKMQFVFEPMQSYLIVVDKNQKDAAIIKQTSKEESKSIELKGAWAVELQDYNALTLDYCQIAVDGGEWSERMPTIAAQEKLLTEGKSVKVQVKYTFDVDSDLNRNKEMYIAVEEAERFDLIEINGNKVRYEELGWWRDISFKKVNIKPYVQTGENCVIMARDFYLNEKSRKMFQLSLGPRRLEANTEINKIVYDVEIESIYLIGDFGVNSVSAYTDGSRKAQFTDGPFVVVEKPEEISGVNSLVNQGLPFYAGSIKLEQDVQLNEITESSRVYLDLGEPRAIISKVYVNGEQVKVLGWRPFKADISSFVKNGNNHITIELFNSCRNLLGPHHHVVGEKYSVRPDNFTTRRGALERETVEEDVWRDRYCFVQFGICSPVTIEIRR